MAAPDELGGREKVWVGVRLRPVERPAWSCTEPGLLRSGGQLYVYDRTFGCNAPTEAVFQALEEKFTLAALQARPELGWAGAFRGHETGGGPAAATAQQ